MHTAPLKKNPQYWLTKIRARMETQEIQSLPMVYLGIVDEKGVVRAEGVRPSMQLAQKNHHNVLGLGKRWTYFENTRWVVWRYELPTREDQTAVSHFLRNRGCIVVRHQINQSGF